jgi:hypothetical protein
LPITAVESSDIHAWSITDPALMTRTLDHYIFAWLNKIKASFSVPEPAVTPYVRRSDRFRSNFVVHLHLPSEPAPVIDTLLKQLHQSISAHSVEKILKDLPHSLRNPLPVRSGISQGHF